MTGIRVASPGSEQLREKYYSKVTIQNEAHLVCLFAAAMPAQKDRTV